LRPSVIVWGQKVMGPNRLVAWQRRAGMSGHVRVVAHMEKNRYGRSLCRVSTFVRRRESQSAIGEVEVTARDGTIGVFENFLLTCGS